MKPNFRTGRKQAVRQNTENKIKKRGCKPHPVIEFPKPRSLSWKDPATFHEALALHMARHGETAGRLLKAIAGPDDRTDRKTIAQWATGIKTPRTVTSLDMLTRIERRYQLPTGYFRAKLPNRAHAPRGHRNLEGISPSERRRLAWHLPDDFDRRTPAERAEIVEWIRRVIITGSTEYRRFQAQALKHRYALRFPELTGRKPSSDEMPDDEDRDPHVDVECELAAASKDAPAALAKEVAQFVRFKTATLTEIGYLRSGVWNEQTALQQVEYLGLLFGALAASPSSPIAGAGVPRASLAMGMLIFPAVWDWYLQWRERRRGFFTAWEVNMLQLGLALTRIATGWLRQHPELADRLRPIPSLVSQEDVASVQADWAGACDAFYQYGFARMNEIRRVARVHRDPFEPVLPILEAESPLGEYRLIVQEIVRLMPDADRYPLAAAEAVRSLLMLRLGLHLGVRQKNLRQLLLCFPGHQPTPERQLELRKCGELRWIDREGAWEVFIPAVAFKNAGSSFFAKRPFQVRLPDLDGLYGYIETYIRRDRSVLLGGLADTDTFFVKTMKRTSKDAAYDQNTFYEAWRLIIQRYGIYNPYTGRGAINGLLPHGPHSVRDVLATHILKQTGSYEQASYAIQDTPEVVAKYYARFLPQDKAALAAQVLNQVWEAA